MRSIIKFVFLLFFAAMISCSPTRQLSNISHQAAEAYEAGDYSRALPLYESLIQRSRAAGELAAAENLNRAGLSAWQLGNTAKAIEYLDAARHSPVAGEQTFAALAKAYRQIDNLSREITNLEEYLERYPQGQHAEDFRQRLFMTYVESRNWEPALELWPSLSRQHQQQEETLEGSFLVHKNLDNEKQATFQAKELLQKNRDNLNALRWMAEKHYWLAENRYQAETKAYEQNRTHRQYAQLLEAFEILNTDFRLSLNYFQRLYRLQPSPAVARYIGNIYLRFDDKERADYYHQLAGQQ